MSEITRYPLCWPDNVARTAPHVRGCPRFDLHTIAEGVQFVIDEITRLNGLTAAYNPDDRTIISTNLKTKNDGTPYSNLGEPSDGGVAVYFFLKFIRNGKRLERQVVLTCDKWNRVGYNLWAIGKDIEAQRGRGRWGCTNLEQAFRGYTAIPERCGGGSWWDILGIPANAYEIHIKDAYRTRAQTEHPDKGGSHERWTRLQEAYEQAMSQFR